MISEARVSWPTTNTIDELCPGVASLRLLQDITRRSRDFLFGQEEVTSLKDTPKVSFPDYIGQSPFRRLLRLLSRSVQCGFEATLAVDRIYSLLNVALNFCPGIRDTVLEALPIDYEADLPTVLMHLAKLYINAERTYTLPDVLSDAVLDRLLGPQKADHGQIARLYGRRRSAGA